MTVKQKPQVMVQKTVMTRRRMEIKLNDHQIRTALDNCGITVPKNATIQFAVPGGGDWSNTIIDIDEENPVLVTWEETETECN